MSTGAPVDGKGLHPHSPTFVDQCQYPRSSQSYRVSEKMHKDSFKNGGKRVLTTVLGCDIVVAGKGKGEEGNMAQRFIKSETATKHGWGTDRFRSVNNLTEQEMAAVRNKSAVVYFTFVPWNWKQSGIKIVTGGGFWVTPDGRADSNPPINPASRFRKLAFDSREPSPAERQAIEELETQSPSR